jgi:hypothetical protein
MIADRGRAISGKREGGGSDAAVGMSMQQSLSGKMVTGICDLGYRLM